MNYSKIFNEYDTTEGVPFYLLSKKINFPEDTTLEIYEMLYCDEDMPWTVLSYKLYNSINYWWVLSALNGDQIFYAKRGEEIRIIKPKFLQTVLQYV